MNYSALSVEELEQKIRELTIERQRVVALARELTALRDAKVRETELREKFNLSSEAEREALRQIISGAGGIASGEKVGE